MKNILIKLTGILALSAVLLGCYKTKSNYPGGVISPYIAIYDVRNLFKEKPVELNTTTLEGSSKLAAIVVSDHSGSNLPDGLLIVQNNPRLSFLRGLAINIGAAAATYQPGDSVHIDLVGGKLERVDGILQVTGVGAANVNKVASARPIPVNRVNADRILANPGDYENTLVAIVKGGFIPPAEAGQVMSGEHSLSDGFGVLPVYTETKASFANNPKYRMANYMGIVFTRMNDGDILAPYLRPRIASDITQLNSVYEIPSVIITGWHNDPQGTDANNEYIQFIATEDINFATTPYSVVTCNNAGTSTPGGSPVNGWATGGLRTYKFNITSGFAAKGTLFYVGGTTKLINSTSSTNISQANWVTTRAYNSATGQDFGNVTTNLLANSGNAYGVAVFKGTTVDKTSIPVDVMFVGTGGTTTLYDNGNGFRICNNDFYDIVNPLTLQEQAFYRVGTNLNAMAYSTPTDAGLYNSWRGEYNMILGRWTKARTKVIVQLTKTSVLEEIENPENIVKLIY